jgi:hypothetical protein
MGAIPTGSIADCFGVARNGTFDKGLRKYAAATVLGLPVPAYPIADTSKSGFWDVRGERLGQVGSNLGSGGEG